MYGVEFIISGQTAANFTRPYVAITLCDKKGNPLGSADDAASKIEDDTDRIARGQDKICGNDCKKKTPARRLAGNSRCAEKLKGHRWMN